MPYCMYLRKSRADMEAEARGEGETLARHEKILWDLAKKLNLYVREKDIYREIVSGETIASRPVMHQVLSEVEQGLWEGVLVVEVERLARGDTMDQGLVAQTFKYSGTKIITPVKTYDPNNEFDEEYFEFGLFMSRREYKTINRRLQSGRTASAKEGKYVGNKPPYGYVRKKLNKEKGYTLEPHPDQADIVKMIFDLYTANDRIGVSLIVRKLNDLGIKPAKGDVWVPASIQSILHNPVYIGKIRWNARKTKKKIIDGQIKRERPRAKIEDCILVDGLHKPLIDIKTWEKAQEYLSFNLSRPVPNKYVVKNPLSGLIICGKCGRKMVRRPYGGRQPDTLMCPVTSCNNVSAPLNLVESNLIAALETWLKGYKVKIEGKNIAGHTQSNIKKKALKKIEDEIGVLEKQKAKQHDLLERGIYSTETFLDRNRNLTERIAAAISIKNSLIKEMEYDELIHRERKELVPKIERIIDIYYSIEDPKIRNDLLKEVLEKAIYVKETGGRWSNKINDFQLDIFPRLPKKA